MKKSNITIPFDDEKYQALLLFAGMKDTNIETELEDAVQKLYEKYVPKDARTLVDMMTGSPPAAKSRQHKKDSATKKLDVVQSAVKPGTDTIGSTSSGNSGD